MQSVKPENAPSLSSEKALQDAAEAIIRTQARFGSAEALFWRLKATAANYIADEQDRINSMPPM